MKYHSLVLCALATMTSAENQNAPIDVDIANEIELELPAGVQNEIVQHLDELKSLVAIRKNEPVSRLLLRRSIERLYATGYFENIVVHAVEVPSGTKFVFDLIPKRKIAKIGTSGGTIFTRTELLQISKLAEGSEYYPERTRDASDLIRTAYQRRGYRRAQVDIQVASGAGDVSLSILLSDGPPTRIQGIVLGDDPGVPLADAVAQIGLKIGDILNQDALDVGIERLKVLYRQRHYYQARIADPVLSFEGEHAWVAIPVTAGPRFSIQFSGNRSFPNRVLLGVVNYQGDEPLDTAMTVRLSKRIASFYRYRGFYEVRVTPLIIRRTETEAAIQMLIEEGFQFFNREIRFVGNKAFRSSALEKIVVDHLLEKQPTIVGDVHPNDDPTDLEGRTIHGGDESIPDPDPKTVYVDEVYRESAELLSATYRTQGYLENRIHLVNAVIDVAQHNAIVTFEVSEGPQTLIEGVQILHAPEGTSTETLATAHVGEPLTDSLLEETRTSLLQLLGQRGYLFARIHHRIELSADHRWARVEFEVEAGPQVRVGRIIVQGLTRTNVKDVIANLSVHEGEALDPQELFDSQRRLLLLGTFRQVAVRLIDPERPEPAKDIVVEIRERPNISADPGIGYTLVEGPLLVLDAALPNIFGSGNNISAYGRINYVGASLLALSPSRVSTSNQLLSSNLSGLSAVGLRGNIELQHPRIYAFAPLQIGSRLDLIGERVFRPSFRFTRFALIPGIDWTLLRWLSFSLQYELEHDRVLASSGIQQLLPTLLQIDQQRLRFPVGIFTLHTLRTTWTVDFRDNPINPRAGFLFSLVTEVTKDLRATLTDPAGNPLSDFSIFTLKTSGNITGYVPFSRSKRTSLALSLRGGKIYRLDPNSKTIPPKRFFLGGASNLRGFREDGVVPADRRKDLAQELAACSALANPSGCTPASQVLLNGYELPSEGGELFTLGKVELRFPVLQSWDGAIFFETGNLWLSQSRYRPWELRYVMGVGARYVTPIGPLAFDFGINLAPDRVINEGSFNVHFSIGLF